jgi:hypothetical protein
VLQLQNDTLRGSSTSQLIQSAKQDTVLFFLEAKYWSSQTAIACSLLG